VEPYRPSRKLMLWIGFNVPNVASLSAQVLRQRDGYALILLSAQRSTWRITISKTFTIASLEQRPALSSARSIDISNSQI
jgi:hypothetical protein